MKDEVEESYPEDLSNEDIALHLARIKAKPYIQELESNSILITADTIVCMDSLILGKPQGFDDAVEMLKGLSGRQHEVITGVCLSGSDKTEAFTVSTSVSFSSLTQEEIVYYVEKYKLWSKN